MTLSAKYQGSIVPIRLGSTVIQGTRAGGARRASLPWPSPSTESSRSTTARITTRPSCRSSRPPRSPGSGLCTSCGQPAGRDPLNPPPPNEFRMIKSAEETSHLEHVKDRRSQADGDRLMTESLRRRDHPEEFRDVRTAGPSPRRKARSVFPIRRINLRTTPSRMPPPDVNGKTRGTYPVQ